MFSDALQPQTILLIEDTLDDEMLALRAFRACERPLLVRVARDGLGARRALGLDGETDANARRLPDLVVSDLKLPWMNGDELLCLVRGDERLARLPYVLFSSSNERVDVERCLRCGVDAFVQKPVDFTEYIDCLSAVTHWALDGFAGTTPKWVAGSSSLSSRDKRSA